jgi:hypothetical protein
MAPKFPEHGMKLIETGRAYCALCGEVIRPHEDALMTPDFLANESDPLWRFNDAPMHRPCFLTWDGRKVLVARYNRLAHRGLVRDDWYPHMTAEGRIVQRQIGRPDGWIRGAVDYGTSDST